MDDTDTTIMDNDSTDPSGSIDGNVVEPTDALICDDTSSVLARGRNKIVWEEKTKIKLQNG